jgi:hypothetical protein
MARASYSFEVTGLYHVAVFYFGSMPRCVSIIIFIPFSRMVMLVMNLPS